MRAGAALVGLLVACAVSLAAAQVPPLGATVRPESGGWRFRPGLSFAYDSFGQRYVLGERDTLDLLDEMSGRLTATLEHLGRSRLALKNTLSLGEQTTRDDLFADLQLQNGRADLRAAQELHYRGYRPGSDFVSSSDCLNGLSRLTARLPLGPNWRLRFDDRFEWNAYDIPSRDSYDMQRNDATIAIERSYGVFSHLDAGYAYGARNVPDSSAIDYRRHVLDANWQHSLGAHDVILEQRLERRSYGDPRLRPHSLDYGGSLLGVVALRPSLRLKPGYRATVLRHDTPDSLYADYTEQTAELLFETDLASSTTLALGPRAEFRRGASSIDRPYDQWSLEGSVTYTLGRTLWLQFTDEVGTRIHQSGDELLFTDYLFNWSTLTLSWQPLPQLGFELFFALDPEVHEEDADNSTLLLISTALTYGWR